MKPELQKCLIALLAAVAAALLPPGHQALAQEPAPEEASTQAKETGPDDELELSLDDEDLEIDLGESTVEAAAIAAQAAATAAAVKAPALSELKQTISRAEIDNSGAADLSELLAREAGIRVSEYLGGTTISYQGLPGKFTTVLVDGQRVPGNILEQHDLSQFSLASLDSVEIISGPRAAAYGAANAGVVINLKTRRGGQQAHMELGYGSLNWNREHFRLGNGDDYQNWVVSIEHQGRDSWDANSARPDTDLNSFENLELRGRWDFRLSSDDTMLLSADWFRETGRGLDYSPPSLLRPSDLATTRTGATMTWRHQLNSGSSLEFTQSYGSYRHGLHRYFESDDPRDERTDFDETTLDSSLRWDNHMEYSDWSVGLQRQSEELSSDRIMAPDGGQTADSELLGLYATYDWRMTPDWTLSLATRLNSHSDFGEELLPSIALSRALDRYSTLTASAGRGYRAPSLRERYYDFPSPFDYTILGNPDLEPELSWNYALDYGYSKSGRSLRLGLFRNEIDNLIDFSEISSTPQVFTLQNFAGVTTQGLSLGAEQRWRADRHHGECAKHWFGIGYDLTWLEEASVAESGLDLVNSPEFDQGLRAFYEAPRLYAELLLRRHDPYWFDADNTVRVPTQDTLNLSLRHDCGNGASLKLSGLNLLDEKDVRFGPLPGRELRLEYSFDF